MYTNVLHPGKYNMATPDNIEVDVYRVIQNKRAKIKQDMGDALLNKLR